MIPRKSNISNLISDFSLNKFRLSAWVKSVQKWLQPIIYILAAQDHDDNYSLRMESDGQISLAVEDVQGKDYMVKSGIRPRGLFHVVASYNKANLILYINQFLLGVFIIYKELPRLLLSNPNSNIW